MVAVDRFVVGRGEAQKRATPGPPGFRSSVRALYYASLQNPWRHPTVGERQGKPVTCIHREKIQLNERTLPHQHKPVGEAEAQHHRLPPCTCPYAPPPTLHNTPKMKLTLVPARPAVINIGLRHPVPIQQAADCTDSAEATGRTCRRHDTNPSVNDIPHIRNK